MAVFQLWAPDLIGSDIIIIGSEKAVVTREPRRRGVLDITCLEERRGFEDGIVTHPDRGWTRRRDCDVIEIDVGARVRDGVLGHMD